MSDERPRREFHDVRCACGEKLVDVVTEPGVTVEDEHIPFRRTTDYLVCPNCASMYRVTDVGNELVTNAPSAEAVESDGAGT